jgi:hypothetical protein
VFSLDLDAKALTKSYRCQPTSSLTACANWIHGVSAATPSHGIAFTRLMVCSSGLLYAWCFVQVRCAKVVLWKCGGIIDSQRFGGEAKWVDHPCTRAPRGG